MSNSLIVDGLKNRIDKKNGIATVVELIVVSPYVKKKKKIRCLQNSNLTELAYLGISVELM